MKKNFLILTITLLILFCLSEIFFRIFYPINSQSWYAEIIDEKKNFVALKKNHYHKIDRWNYKYYTSYNLGEFRNRVTQKIGQDKDKILILGDSFTFGLFLKNEDTYIDKLQNEFKNFNLINSSTPGWGLEDYYMFTKNFCNIINPKKTIVILNDGDLGRIKDKVIKINNTKKSLKEKYRVYKFFIENFMTISFLRESIYKIINYEKNIPQEEFEGTNIYFDPSTAKEVVKDSKKIFLLLRDISNDCNSSLYIINLGWNYNISEDKKLSDPMYLLLNDEIDFFKKNEINFFDNKNYLKHINNNKQKYIIKNEGHPNEHGADEIFKSLLIHFTKILT